MRIQWNYCMFQVAYTVRGVKKNKWWDEAVFIKDNSQLIPTYYQFSCEFCSNLLSGISVKLPGIRNEDFTSETILLMKIQVSKKNLQKKSKLAGAFMKGGKKKV